MNISRELYNDELKRIGAELRTARESAGMTLNEVGAILGVTPSTVGKIENGLCNVTAVYLLALSRVYALDLCFVSRSDTE